MIAQIQMRRGTTAEWAAASPVVLAAGEMGLDTTIQKSKIGDGTTEWASLPWLNGDVTNANILHNWDFRNPVNQRSVSGAISTGTYFFDRWIRNSGTVTVAAGYLTLASGAVIEQRIEGLYLAGATVTLSVRVGSTIYSGTNIFPAVAGTAYITLTGFGTATLGYNAGYMSVRFTASGSQNVVAVKCELGTVSTLHLDPPVDHAVELPKCQRFFEVMQSPGFYRSLAFNAYQLYSNNVFFSVPKRVVPTVVLISESGSERGMITERNASSVFVKNMLSEYTAYTRGFSIYTKDEDNRYTAGYDYRFRYEASADL